MSRHNIWAHPDIPPKYKLERWAKQALVAKAEAFLTDFYRSTFACPGPNALSPFFETNFARFGYFGPDR